MQIFFKNFFQFVKLWWDFSQMNVKVQYYIIQRNQFICFIYNLSEINMLVVWYNISF